MPLFGIQSAEPCAEQLGELGTVSTGQGWIRTIAKLASEEKASLFKYKEILITHHSKSSSFTAEDDVC